MDFEALIKKHVGEDGSVDVAKLATAIASNVGREFVEKKRYDDKLHEIEQLKTEKQTAEDSATAAAGWKKKHDDLKQRFEDYKADVAGKETLAAVKAAHRKLLHEQKIDDADIDLIVAATDYSGMKLDDKGGLADAENIKADIVTRYARYIPKDKSSGDESAKPIPGADNGGANPRAAEREKMFRARRYGIDNDKKGENA